MGCTRVKPAWWRLGSTVVLEVHRQPIAHSMRADLVEPNHSRAQQFAVLVRQVLNCSTSGSGRWLGSTTMCACKGVAVEQVRWA